MNRRFCVRVFGAYAFLIAWAAFAATGVTLTPGARTTARSALRLTLDGRGPHTIGTVAALAAHNSAIALAPLALRHLGLATRRTPRRIFGTAIGAMLALNGALVGAALATCGPALVPFLIHLPLEWLALSLGAAAWLTASHALRGRGDALRLALATLVAVIGAALLEVYATPRST